LTSAQPVENQTESTLTSPEGEVQHEGGFNKRGRGRPKGSKNKNPRQMPLTTQNTPLRGPGRPRHEPIRIVTEVHTVVSALYTSYYVCLFDISCRMALWLLFLV